MGWFCRSNRVVAAERTMLLNPVNACSRLYTRSHGKNFTLADRSYQRVHYASTILHVVQRSVAIGDRWRKFVGNIRKTEQGHRVARSDGV